MFFKSIQIWQQVSTSNTIYDAKKTNNRLHGHYNFIHMRSRNAACRVPRIPKLIDARLRRSFPKNPISGLLSIASLEFGLWSSSSRFTNQRLQRLMYTRDRKIKEV